MSRRPFGPSKGAGVAGVLQLSFLTPNFSHRDLESIAQVCIARSLPTVPIATPPPAKERKNKEGCLMWTVLWQGCKLATQNSPEEWRAEGRRWPFGTAWYLMLCQGPALDPGRPLPKDWEQHAKPAFPFSPHTPACLDWLASPGSAFWTLNSRGGIWILVSSNLDNCIALWSVWLKLEVSLPPSGWGYTTVSKNGCGGVPPQHPPGASPNPESEEVSSFVLHEWHPEITKIG